VRNRINHVKEISSKAVVEAKEIEGKHAALYNLMMQDIAEVDDQIQRNKEDFILLSSVMAVCGLMVVASGGAAMLPLTPIWAASLGTIGSIGGSGIGAVIHGTKPLKELFL